MDTRHLDPVSDSYNITLVTPPDLVHNLDHSVFLMYPSAFIREQFQEVLTHINKNINVYVCTHESQTSYEWMLSALNKSKYVIVDVDNVPDAHREVISYAIAHSNVYWITNRTYKFYDVISNNRIYDLDWIKHKLNGEHFEEHSTT